jgi:hypothetical protein
MPKYTVVVERRDGEKRVRREYDVLSATSFEDAVHQVAHTAIKRVTPAEHNYREYRKTMYNR